MYVHSFVSSARLSKLTKKITSLVTECVHFHTNNIVVLFLILIFLFREDLQNSEAGRDVLIKKAWETRDAAVKRKNNTEIELAKTRIDVMQVSGLQFYSCLHENYRIETFRTSK